MKREIRKSVCSIFGVSVVNVRNVGIEPNGNNLKRCLISIYHDQFPEAFMKRKDNLYNNKDTMILQKFFRIRDERKRGRSSTTQRRGTQKRTSNNDVDLLPRIWNCFILFLSLRDLCHGNLIERHYAKTIFFRFFLSGGEY